MICGLGPQGYELALEALASLIEAEPGEAARMKVGGRRAPLAPDADVIRALAGLLAETGLTEIEYAVGDTASGSRAKAPSGAAGPHRATNGGHANGARNGAALAADAEPPHGDAEQTATNGARPPRHR